MRHFLLFVRTVTLILGLGWTTGSHAQSSAAIGETVYDLHTLQPVSVQVLLEVMNRADLTVLGEIHDNPRHHVVRGEWLRTLRPQTSVVAEHMTAPLQVSASKDLLKGLSAAGFDPQGWQWPLHQPLFASIQERRLPLWGGNIRKEDSPGIFKSKGESAPPVLVALLAKAPLSEQGRQDLQREIDDGHCGALPSHMFEGMMAVQRTRDASMAHAALQHLPAVVLAGNGHAWKHLGVPQIIRANRPDVHVVSVLLLEHEPFANDAEQQTWLKSWVGKADYVWAGPAIQRPDPCLRFKPSK